MKLTLSAKMQRGVGEGAVGVADERALGRLREARQGDRVIVRVAVVGQDVESERRVLGSGQGVIDSVRRVVADSTFSFELPVAELSLPPVMAPEPHEASAASS